MGTSEKPPGPTARLGGAARGFPRSGDGKGMPAYAIDDDAQVEHVMATFA